MSFDDKLKLLDCDKGRELGCKSFCCRLLVRLTEHEMTEFDPVLNRRKGFVPKDESGRCIHQDGKTGLCQNWEKRPSVCREYDCNYDDLLQFVIKSKKRRITDWIKESVTQKIKKEDYISVPYTDIS